ncbi:MAG: hypothetical protein K2X27_21490 [Candidatus Obscuribacterales bacterium]|nr:hypothetical protein [Candidatus Obscuribacterales bacterium]
MADQIFSEDDLVKEIAATATEGALAKAVEGFRNELSADSGSRSLSAQGDAAKKGEGGTAGGGVGFGSMARSLMEEAGKNNAVHEKASVFEQIKDALKNADASDEPRYERAIRDLLAKPDGVKKLSTGDTLVCADGRESVFTPGGDRVTVNPDGSHSIKGNLKSVEKGKNGETVVTFKDGASVAFDASGIQEIRRGRESVSFRWSDYFPGPQLQKRSGHNSLPQIEIRP